MGANGKKDEKAIPNSHSPVRHLINEAHNLEHRFIENYEQAIRIKNSVVILEGDWGGQIYLVCPMDLIKCDKESLENLLDDLDKIAWECNDGEGKGIYYEIREIGESVAGGMGGGVVSNTPWVHDEFEAIYEDIQKVIGGKRKRLK
ncbi:hypothetical protein [Brevibacillus sp. SYSU BS000544]|uniref:hypothetical protein n=1 Tax=Brevibacillus sp. SYSU BS000544 TaxID=3416443 RepID=UPI003CE4B855